MTNRTDSFTDAEFEIFSQLIAQESHTWEGQAKLMDIIKSIAKQRIDAARDELKKEYNMTVSDSGLSLHRVLDESSYSFEEVALPVNDINGKPYLQPVYGFGDHVKSIEGNKMVNRSKALNVIFNVHVDGFPFENPELLKMHTDAHNPDLIIARKSYDMIGGALVMLNLMPKIKVPNGMNLFFCPVYDEETHSQGAKALLDRKRWDWADEIDIVLSNEIGHVEVSVKDKAMRYLPRRMGREKYHLTLELHPDSRGHFADDHTKSVTQALVEAGFLIVQRFNKGYNILGKDGGWKYPTKRSFPDFGDEKLDLDTVSSKADDKRKTSKACTGELYFEIRSVPPRTLLESEKEQRQIIEEIAFASNWKKHGIHYSLKQCPEPEQSYEPYTMSINHPFCTLVHRILSDITGVEAIAETAPSVADENLYASAIKNRHNGDFPPYCGVISIPPIGNNAHREDEFVSLSSLRRAQEAIRRIIEDADGLAQLIAIKERYLK